MTNCFRAASGRAIALSVHYPGGVTSVRVLLVEDDERLAQLTARYLETHQVLTTIAPDGQSGLALALAEPFDVVLLDVMLPGRSGLEVCRALRERSDVPIIMLTARGEEADRVLGLELGADDYVPKPFSSRELLARIHAHVRRARHLVGPAAGMPVRAGRLVVDAATLTATLDGVALSLTAYEHQLLRAFAERAGRVLSREQLLEIVKGDASEVFDRAIDVRISRLRQKLGDDPKQPRLLKTVRGLGYLLVADDAAAPGDGGEP